MDGHRLYSAQDEFGSINHWENATHFNLRSKFELIAYVSEISIFQVIYL